MVGIDLVWASLIIGVWACSQGAVLWSMWRIWRKLDDREPAQVWDDWYDNWYPDYPFSNYGSGETKSTGPDKHEEEE